MLSAALASPPLLVIGSGSTVVTWDCRNQESPQAVEEGLKSFIPFNNNSAGDGGASPKIADLAWNHNGQGMCSMGGLDGIWC